MIAANDLRRGVVFELDGSLYQVLEFQHVKPGKGPAFVRTRIREIRTGKTVDRSWRSEERVRDVRLERRTYEMLYRSEDGIVVMDPGSYEQLTLEAATVGDAEKYLVENTRMEVLFNGSEPILVEPPNFVDLVVVSTDPGLRGDTASGGSKPATLETGLVVQVPLFIREGEKLKIDTRTDTYIERVKD